MSKSKEELIEEARQSYAEEVMFHSDPKEHGDWVVKQIEKAHTAGKKARDEELLEVVEEIKHPEETMSQRRRGCGNHNAGYECCRNQTLTDIKNRLTNE